MSSALCFESLSYLILVWYQVLLLVSFLFCIFVEIRPFLFLPLCCLLCSCFCTGRSKIAVCHESWGRTQPRVLQVCCFSPVHGPVGFHFLRDHRSLGLTLLRVTNKTGWDSPSVLIVCPESLAVTPRQRPFWFSTCRICIWTRPTIRVGLRQEVLKHHVPTASCHGKGSCKSNPLLCLGEPCFSPVLSVQS